MDFSFMSADGDRRATIMTTVEQYLLPPCDRQHDAGIDWRAQAADGGKLTTRGALTARPVE
jgi:hypothetical protein